MKKILFVMPKLQAGGAEKSLLMLLYTLAERKDVSIDLLLFKKEGIFLEQLPQNIHIIEADSTLHCLYSRFSISNIASLRDFGASIIRPISTVISKCVSKTYNERNQIRWNWFYKRILPMLEGDYDYACGYLDGEPVYYVVDKVRARTKIAWNQNDYVKTGFASKRDIKYFDKIDTMVCLSDECEKIFVEQFPSMKEKVDQIPPMVSADYILRCANEFMPQEYENEKGIKLVSVGRLVEQKGFDIAIEAAKCLRDNKVQFQWFIIGNGELKEDLQKQIDEYSLNEYVQLIGERSNPYPYIHNADVFVQPSRFEGKSVILNETKMLCKPIVVSNYSTVYDQIENEYDGLIGEMNGTGIAEAIMEILTKDSVKNSLIHNLQNLMNQDDSVENKYLALFELKQE